MKKNLLLSLILLFAFFAHGQQTKWNYLEQQKASNASYELIKSSTSEIVVKFSQTAYGLRTVHTEKGDAYIVVPAKGSQIEKKGAPDLGKITQSIIIPNTNGMEIKIVDSKYVELENIEIAPSKGVISRDKKPENISYEWGKEYQQNAFYPAEIAYLSDPYIIRDFRGQVIITQPFQYNPVTKTLRIYKEITLQVVSTGKAGLNQLSKNKAASEVDPNFVPIYSRHFLNFPKNKYTSLPENGGKLLIITYDSFADEMQPFVDWKNSIGIQTTMVNYSTIGSSAALKTYVQNYYNSNGLTYLLIVGDNAQVPTSSTSAGDSDNNYGYTAGSDHYLDIFVGRFSAENATQVTTMVNRTIYYERDMLNSSASVTKGIGIASNEGTGGGGDDDESDATHMNNIQTDLTNYGYAITKCYQDGGSTSALSTLINNGTGLINYVGHGSNTGWYAPSFTNTNVDALTNTNKYPFIFSVACVVGNFKSITCFAESWLRATDNSGNPAGAVVFCGSTINQSWASPMCAQDEMNDLLVANAYKSYGGIFVNGMFQMIDEYGTDGANMADTWTVFGDPSLQTRTPGHPSGPTTGTDTQAPTAPSNLAASNVATTTLTLNWTASTDNVGVTGYDIYRNGSLLTSTTNTTYNVTGLTAATSYSFYVKAKDAAGNVSAASNTINVTTTAADDTSAPTAPTNLAASNIAQTTLSLNWTASTDNVGVTGYDVYRNGSLYTSVTTNSANISGLTANTSYSFYVKAKDGMGNISQSSNTINVTTLPVVQVYCSSKGSNYSYEWISKVVIGSFTNTSSASGYTDFTSKTITLTPGSSVSVSLTPGFASSTYNEYWKIWIDYNGDADFDDANELVFDAGALSKTIVNGSITVPSGVSGTTRMRVSMKYNGAQTQCETFSYGEVEDYTVTFGAVVPDTEAPSIPSGLASSGVTQTSATISWTASTDNVQVTGYEVYKNGVLAGTTATTSYSATGLSANTSYAFTVKAYDAAGNKSAASSALSVNTLPNIITYCTSKGNNVSYEWIDYVELGGMTNLSAANAGYADFTSKVATVEAGTNATVYVSAGFNSSSYTEYWRVWIDWDQNGTFDSDELMASGSSSSSANLSYSFTVPSDALSGSTRMRVSMKYNGAPTACETFSYGEVEDYTVNVGARGLSGSQFSNTVAQQLGNELDNYSITIAPNPVRDNILRISIGAPRSTEYAIYNISGSKVIVGKMDSQRKEINISSLGTGVYIIKVNDGQREIYKNFVKE